LRNPAVQKHIYYIDRLTSESLGFSIWSGLVAMVLVMVIFVARGYQQSQQKLERGNQILPASKLAKLIKRRKQASDLVLDDLPLIKDKETSHTLITGTTGSGKTNCLHTLLPQIRERPNRAIIVDLTGDFVSK